MLITPDAACSYILKPDQDVRRFFAQTHTNHYGMRSDEVPVVRQAGTLRLMFVGDSITYGTSRVDQQELFTEVLHRELPALVHRPVEVLNASAGGWAPDNELAYIQSRGIFQSDMVLLVLNDGDLPQEKSTIAGVGDDLPQKRPATAIGELFTRYIKPRIGRLLERSDAGDRIDAINNDVIRKNLEDLDSVLELVRSHGARLTIVYIPFRRNVPEFSKVAGSTLRAWSHAHQVGMFDLTSAEAPYTARQITLDNGIHLNAKGHRVIAQAIERSWVEVAGNR
ncbi:MAG: SGNH/GDSL hydrolase family protein [Terracidiphilus sp.]